MDKNLANAAGCATIFPMPETTELISYERLLLARPALLWALERKWSADEAASKGMELESAENSAWLVLEGEARVDHGGATHRAGPGMWMFPKPGKRNQSFSGDFHFLSVTIRWQWPGGRHLFDEGLTRTLESADAPWLETAARELIRQVSETTPHDHYHIGRHPVTLAQSARLFELAGGWASMFIRAMDHLGVKPDTGANGDPRVVGLLAKLREASALPLPDRGALAAAAGVSSRQLDRLLKNATGKTLAENHDAFRFERARSGLLERGLRVKEVASESGFDDLSSFSRWFSKHAGCSPRSFRDQYAAI